METLTTMEPKTRDALQELLGVNIDSAEGLRHAAMVVRDPDLCGLFRDLAAERSLFREELAACLDVTDASPREVGSFRAQMHRWWVEFRALLEAGDAYAILAEVERGEDRIKARYEKVITEIPGNPVSDVLHRQYARVKAAHDRIRDLRDARR